MGEGPGALGESMTDQDRLDDVDLARADIEQTRGDMTETIDAIQEKLTPGHMVNQAKDATMGMARQAKDATVEAAQQAVTSTGETAKAMPSTMVETVKQNPLPAAVAGIGIGWLILRSRQQRSTTPNYRTSGYSATDSSMSR